MTRRQLYQCLHARVRPDDLRIYCHTGHHLNGHSSDATINIKRVLRREPLELGICQTCKDYSEMGEPLSRQDRGWVPNELEKEAANV